MDETDFVIRKAAFATGQTKKLPATGQTMTIHYFATICFIWKNLDYPGQFRFTANITPAVPPQRLQEPCAFGIMGIRTAPHARVPPYRLHPAVPGNCWLRLFRERIPVLRRKKAAAMHPVARVAFHAVAADSSDYAGGSQLPRV